MSINLIRYRLFLKQTLIIKYMSMKVSKTIYPKEVGTIKEVKHWSNNDRKKFFTNYNQILADYLVSLKQEKI